MNPETTEGREGDGSTIIILGNFVSKKKKDEGEKVEVHTKKTEEVEKSETGGAKIAGDSKEKQRTDCKHSGRLHV